MIEQDILKDLTRKAIGLQEAWVRKPRPFQIKIEDSESGTVYIARRAPFGINIGTFTEDGMWNPIAFVSSLSDSLDVTSVDEGMEGKVMQILVEGTNLVK